MVPNPSDPADVTANTITVEAVISYAIGTKVPANLSGAVSATRRRLSAFEVLNLAKSGPDLFQFKRTLKNKVESARTDLYAALSSVFEETLTVDVGLRCTLTRWPIGGVRAFRVTGGIKTQTQVASGDTLAAAEFKIDPATRAAVFEATDLANTNQVTFEYTGLPLTTEHVSDPTTPSDLATYRVNINFDINAWLDGVYSAAIESAAVDYSILPGTAISTEDGSVVPAIASNGFELAGRIIVVRSEQGGDPDLPVLELLTVFLPVRIKSAGTIIYPTDTEVEQGLDALIEGTRNDRLTGWANVANIVIQRNNPGVIVQSITDLVGISLSVIEEDIRV
jgi:hypothetical protein